jgi:hypothetical protein
LQMQHIFLYLFLLHLYNGWSNIPFLPILFCSSLLNPCYMMIFSEIIKPSTPQIMATFRPHIRECFLPCYCAIRLSCNLGWTNWLYVYNKSGWKKSTQQNNDIFTHFLSVIDNHCNMQTKYCIRLHNIWSEYFWPWRCSSYSIVMHRNLCWSLCKVSIVVFWLYPTLKPVVKFLHKAERLNLLKNLISIVLT